MPSSAQNGRLQLELGPGHIVMLFLDLLLLQIRKKVFEFYIAKCLQEMRLFY